MLAEVQLHDAHPLNKLSKVQSRRNKANVA